MGQSSLLHTAWCFHGDRSGRVQGGHTDCVLKLKDSEAHITTFISFAAHREIYTVEHS